MDPAVAGTPASAPPAAFEDGLGERRHTVGAGNEPLEVLRLSTELSAVSSFEFALRERASRFVNFRHESFARVRAVERLDKLASTLVVVSDHIRGVRLSDMLASAHKRPLPLELDAALSLIRQLVSAVAAMHESVPDICHGAIGPERIIVTPEGRLVIVEYVLGAALEQLRYSQDRYWKELRIALPRTIGLPRFDELSDVTQVGTVALALILSRPLGSHEYPGQIGEVAGQASGKSSTGGSASLPASLRIWLLRALQLDPRGSFGSSAEANADLELALADHDSGREREALKAFMARYATPLSSDAPATVAAPPVVASAPAAPAPSPVNNPPPAVVSMPAAAPTPVASAPVAPTPVAAPRPVAVSTTPPVSSTPAPVPSKIETPKVEVPKADTAKVETAKVETPKAETPKVETPKPAAVAATSHAPTSPSASTRKAEDSARRTASREAESSMAKKMSWPPRNWMIAAAAVALIVVTMGVTMMGRRYFSASANAAETGTLIVGTNPEGIAVVVDGKHRGNTPLSVENLAPGDHVLELVTETEHRRLPVRITAGGQVSQFLEMPKTAPALGDLQIRTEPSRAKVTVDGHVFGRSPLVIKNLAPGPHTVMLENESGSITEEVTIEAGQTAALLVPMTKPQTGNVSGWIAISAPADVQVFENQRLLGSSRSDRIMVAVGRHDLEIVNEALGYRATRSVEVEPGKVANIRLEWPKGTMALNALPWAEVWVDGERIGETPIGSVSVPIGSHEVVFRHPELGERRSTVNVTTGSPARVSIDLRTK